MMAQVNAGRVRFVGRGEYNNSTQYYIFDLVSYNGNSYYAKVDTIGHLPTDTTYWQLVAEKGNVGPTGLTGNGISSIEKTSTSGLVDTYTITYTNGNTTTFDVSNGNGIDRIEKTATVGNKDTYTIYFTNGSTTTYEVSNGEVTREELEEEVERLSMIYNAFPTTTGEVEEGSINGTAEVPFKEIGLKGNTSQESTTGANQIGLKPVSSTTLNGLTYSVEGDILSINGTANAKTDMQKMLFNLTSTTSKTLRFYLVSGTFTNGNIGVHLNEYESSGQVSFIQIPYNTTDLKSTKIIDLTNVNYVWVYATSGSVFTNAKFRIMLSDNASDTYEPYTGGNPAPSPSYPYPVHVVTGDNSITIANSDNTQSQTYPINLGSMELCKIGDYQDRIYKNNGTWYIEKKIGKVVLDGSESWINQSGVYDTETRMFFSVRISGLRANINNRKGISNYFINSNTSVQSPYVDTTAFNFHPEAQYSNYIYIKIDKNQLSSQDATGFKNWLSNHNTIVYFQIDPTITEITDTTLIEQLDNLEKAYSYDTQTNISQTNQDKPFIISYEAILSLRNILNS